MYEAYGITRETWWRELTIDQVRLRVHVAEKRTRDRAKVQSIELASDAIEIMRKLGIVK